MVHGFFLPILFFVSLTSRPFLSCLTKVAESIINVRLIAHHWIFPIWPLIRIVCNGVVDWCYKGVDSDVLGLIEGQLFLQRQVEDVAWDRASTLFFLLVCWEVAHRASPARASRLTAEYVIVTLLRQSIVAWLLVDIEKVYLRPQVDVILSIIEAIVIFTFRPLCATMSVRSVWHHSSVLVSNFRCYGPLYRPSMMHCLKVASVKSLSRGPLLLVVRIRGESCNIVHQYALDPSLGG